MLLSADRATITMVLRSLGISLAKPEIDAVRQRVASDGLLLRELLDAVDGLDEATQPVLNPVSTNGGPIRGQAVPPVVDAAAERTMERLGFPSLRRHQSPTEAVEAALAQIESHRDKTVFISVFAGEARERARDLERNHRLDRKELPLWGTTVAIKDFMNIEGYRTTGGSRALGRSLATRDSEVVGRLRHAGAVIIGATNMDELASGATGENPVFGRVVNPAAPTRYSGGSSSGSAAAVGFGMATFGIGTDTGGSIRIPASACGVVGLKPSFGIVSRDGVVPLTYSLDHVGPLTQTVSDAALVLDVLTGRPGAFTHGLDVSLRGVRIGVPRGFFALGEEPILEGYERRLKRAEAAGAELVPVSLTLVNSTAIIHPCISGVEAVAIHYRTLLDNWDKLGPGVRVHWLASLFIPAHVRLHALRLRRHMYLELAKTFEDVDVIATPTLPIAPPPAGVATVAVQDEEWAVADAFPRNTRPFNLTGVPAITIPNGADENGVPMGLQFIGPYGHDKKLLQVARAMERDV